MLDENFSIIYLSILLVWITFSLMRRYAEEGWGKGLKMALSWLLIFATVFGAVVYWEDFTNTKYYTALVPGKPAIGAEGELRLHRAANGHFHLRAEVNGVNVNFIVDTGASNLMLSRDDARRIGLKPETLTYTIPLHTANGKTAGAPVSLDIFSFGGYTLRNIPAMVNAGELRTSLLGMRFLDNFRRYTIEGDTLVLYP